MHPSIIAVFIFAIPLLVTIAVGLYRGDIRSELPEKDKTLLKQALQPTT